MAILASNTDPTADIALSRAIEPTTAAPMTGHISSMELSVSMMKTPSRTATGAHTTAQAKPSKTAPRNRFSHCFIAFLAVESDPP
ncbi:MAG: hypothetical protein ABIV11_06200 [Gemmatimonadaceae bacterium]